ncbi:MAG TPA: helix-turn-helix domain-containing protein, partial [Nitrospiria bacterium]|nr:helix-turn-helix domain-containing protein [Nitrospiria bacterium]
LETQPAEPLRPDRAPTLKEHEQMMIRKTLEECQWVIEGSHGAASRLDMPPSTLRDRMRKYGIEKQQGRG